MSDKFSRNRHGKREISPIDMLFDPNCTDPITLYNENGEKTEFEQIAIIPIGDTTYFILSPITHIEGVGEDEGLVFTVQEIDDEEALVIVTDMEVIDAVFDIYDQLVAEEGN
jgi:hypothetical protein